MRSIADIPTPNVTSVLKMPDVGVKMPDVGVKLPQSVGLPRPIRRRRKGGATSLPRRALRVKGMLAAARVLRGAALGYLRLASLGLLTPARLRIGATARATTGAARSGRLATRTTWAGGRVGMRLAGTGAKTGSKAALFGVRIGLHRSKLVQVVRPLANALEAAAAQAAEAQRPQRRPLRDGIIGALLGAAAVFLLDPASGSHRRSALATTLGRLARRGREQAPQMSADAQQGDGERDPLRALEGRPEQPTHTYDDATLARKVESEIFRADDAPKGSVDVNAENGVVYLRGQTDSVEWTEQLVSSAAGVEGVVEVRNLLHIAGEPARTIEDDRESG